MRRFYNLDYLRGLAAFGIMVYHYRFWLTGEFSSDSFMGRVGLYGVSIFYVLSGLTLFLVYYEKMQFSKEAILQFFKKRFFRIFPLLWLATIAAIIISKKAPDPYDLFLNLTGLFGFIKWDAYFATGAWSIGNELVFYVFFPFFILFSKHYKPLMIILATFIFGLFLYFAFINLDAAQTLNVQWTNYINPLNQVFLFAGGFLIGLFFQPVRIGNWQSLFLLLVAIGMFIFLPVSGDRIHLVTGINRLIFTLSCLLICLSFYKLSVKVPVLIHKPLALLGEASYSVYLLHPIVFVVVSYSLSFLGRHGIHCPDNIRLILAITATLAVSYLVYEYFEKYFMRLGKSSGAYVKP